MNTVMISCRQRRKARSLTVPQFKAIGITPKVFLSPCNPAGGDGNRAVSLEAVTWALSQPGPMLFLEDDIDLAPDFTWHLERAKALDAITYLYLNDSYPRLTAHFGPGVTSAVRAKRAIQRGQYRVINPAALYGTQCVYIPERLKETIHGLLAAPPDGTAFDTRLLQYLQRVRPEVFVMLPHPVQHRQDRTARKDTHRQRPRLSLTYGHPVSRDIPLKPEGQGGWLGAESKLARKGDRVVKTYTDNYNRLNSRHRRPLEVHWYRARPISDMPRLLAIGGRSITLEYAGEPIGNPRYEVAAEHRTPQLAAWLEKLQADLTNAGVSHGDIHAGNILHLNGHYSLIDWTWASRKPIKTNPNPPDTEAIAKLLEVISQ